MTYLMQSQRQKMATLGEDGNSGNFEASLSSLAHAVLKDKCPTLLDYEQGFQLLERGDDNDRAVGVVGFKVGSQQIFVPIFFLQGNVKGTEMLYLKNSDLFMPLKENWLNYLLNRKPAGLGKGTPRNTGSLGVRQPELNRLSMSPHKFASWAQPAVPAFAHTALLDTRKAMQDVGEALNMPAFLKQADLRVLETLVEFLTTHPKIAAAFDEYHGLETVHAAIKAAGIRANSVLAPNAQPRKAPPLYGSVLDVPRAQHPVKTGELQIITYDATQETELPNGLTEEDQEKLLKDTVLIRDRRTGEQVSVPYSIQVQRKLFNPTETGLYQVLTKPGTFEKCFIAMQPYGAGGQVHFATLVRVEGEADWCNAHPSRIWCVSKIEDAEYTKWWDALPTPDSLEKSDNRYMLLGQRGAATLPFRVDLSLGTENDRASYDVNFSDYCEYGLDKRPYPVTSCCGPCCGTYDGQRVHINGKDGTSFRVVRGDVWVPKGAKLLKVQQAQVDADAKSTEPCCGSSARSSTMPLRPGDYIDAEIGIITKTASLKVHFDGTQYSINNAATQSPLPTLLTLVRDHGFREDVARELMKQAAVKRVLRCRVKYAAPYLTQDGPTAPFIPDPPYGENNIMGSTAPTQGLMEQHLTIPELSAAQTDRAIYNPSPASVGDPMDAQRLQSAAESGQKEIFDTAMIGSLLKSTRDDTMIERHIPDLVKGMDRLGRLLFAFYWHGDRFSERYGKADMSELEDALRNSFEDLGDVIMFLKQKTIEPYPEETSTSTDLGEVA